MSSRPADSAPRPPRLPVREAGAVTLIELVVATVLSGIVLAVTIEMLMGQARFARLQSAREEVQQNARSLLELLTSELRGADPRGLSEAQPGAITFRSTRVWGVVCSHSSARLAALFPTPARSSLRTGDESLAIPPVGATAEWQFLDVSDLTGNVAERAEAQAACGALASSLTFGTGAASLARMYAPPVVGGVAGTLGIPAGAAGLPPGTPLYLYDIARYQTAQTGGSGDWWVRRNTGPALQMHPLAGPVFQHGGLVFAYFNRAGDAMHELSSQAARNEVQRIEVTVVAHSRERFGGLPQRDSATSAVFLRNRY
jgi:hypothetical protein